MWVPQPRLLWWIGLAVCPALALAPTGDTAAALAIVLVAATFLAAAHDAHRVRRRLAPLSVSLPEITRLAKGRPATLALRIDPGGARGMRLRLALGLQPHLETPEPERTVDLPGSIPSVLPWNITGPRRGRFVIGSCHVETISPLGFWAGRRVFALHSEVRVQPDLAGPMRRNAAFLARGGAGIHARRLVGRGREFEKLREYVAGDGFDEIHWRATAKRGHPVTKVFQVERTQEVYVVVDASRLSGRVLEHDDDEAPRSERRHAEPLLEQFIQSSLLLGAVAERQGDLFGLVTFADQPDGFVRAGSGREHFSACRERLVELESRPVSPDFEELATFLRLRLRRRALLLFLTSLDDPVAAEGFLRGIEILRRQHLCAVVQPMPHDVVPMFSGEPAGSLDDAYVALAGHLRWQDAQGLQVRLQRRGVTLVQAPVATLGAALITRYLDVKRRQIL